MISTGMCGFNQSEWIFLIWIVLVSNQILISFYGILIENSCPIRNSAPFYTFSFQITKKFIFVQIVVSNQRNLLRTEIFQISKIILKSNRKNK